MYCNECEYKSKEESLDLYSLSQTGVKIIDSTKPILTKNLYVYFTFSGDFPTEGVRYILYANGKPVREEEVSPIEFERHVLDNVRIFNKQGQAIDYTVDITPMIGYKTQIKGNQDEGFLVTLIKE